MEKIPYYVDLVREIRRSNEMRLERAKEKVQAIRIERQRMKRGVDEFDD